MRMYDRSMALRYRSPGARSKLYQFYVTGALLSAAFVGLVFSSWIVFGIMFAAVVLLNVIGGNIRLGGSRRRRIGPSREGRPFS